MSLNVILQVKTETVKTETIDASDENSNMPLLRKEFSKIFEDLFTITFFKAMTNIYDRTKN